MVGLFQGSVLCIWRSTRAQVQLQATLCLLLVMFYAVQLPWLSVEDTNRLANFYHVSIAHAASVWQLPEYPYGPSSGVMALRRWLLWQTSLPVTDHDKANTVHGAARKYPGFYFCTQTEKRQGWTGLSACTKQPRKFLLDGYQVNHLK